MKNVDETIRGQVDSADDLHLPLTITVCKVPGAYQLLYGLMDKALENDIHWFPHLRNPLPFFNKVEIYNKPQNSVSIRN